MDGVVGLVGRSGSGKTTLIEAVLPLLRARGLRVSTIKHSHKPLRLDQPGKDSFRHRAAGAVETLVAGDRGWALHGGGEGRPRLAGLLARLAPVDLVLVEGFGAEVTPRIEICRAARMAAAGGAPLWPDDSGIGTVVTDAPAHVRGRRHVLPLDDPGAVALWLAGHRCAESREPGD